MWTCQYQSVLHHTVCLFTLVIKSNQVCLYRYFLPEINTLCLISPGLCELAVEVGWNEDIPHDVSLVPCPPPVTAVPLHGPVPSRDYYCRRPILCFASSKILTPHAPLRQAICELRGEDTLAGCRGGWGGQYFGRRTIQLCTLPLSNPNCPVRSILRHYRFEREKTTKAE
jgi:hypothetical protein